MHDYYGNGFTLPALSGLVSTPVKGLVWVLNGLVSGSLPLSGLLAFSKTCVPRLVPAAGEVEVGVIEVDFLPCQYQNAKPAITTIMITAIIRVFCFTILL